MISASFLGIKENLKENLEKLNETNITYFHFDIMDGKFVENKTWEKEDLKSMILNLTKPFDIHLMVENPIYYVKAFQEFHPEYITFHVETKEVSKTIELIKKTGSKVGLALKPNTKVEQILPYLSQVDLILVMTVEPGKGGQPFMSEMISKIKTLNALKKDYHYQIEVDGGINPETKQLCKSAGADIFVVGSYITSSSNYEKQVSQLLD